MNVSDIAASMPVYRIEIKGTTNGETYLTFSFDGNMLRRNGSTDVNFIISAAQELKNALEKLSFSLKQE